VSDRTPLTTPSVPCETCHGDGVITVGGHSVNPSSGVLVSDPQEAHDERCPTCSGAGLVQLLLCDDPTYADRSITVYKAQCPECKYALEWAIEMPPIPMTFFSWFDPNGEGERIHFCPRCDHELPDGDLTKQAA
jgi:hypothetical protein